MGGGSTTVLGPKKVGASPAVVTGVLRSPGAPSMPIVSPSEAHTDAGVGLPPELAPEPPLYRQVSKLNTLKWCAAAAAVSVKRNAEDT